MSKDYANSISDLQGESVFGDAYGVTPGVRGDRRLLELVSQRSCRYADSIPELAPW